jgi:hypothetical protein
MSVVVIDVRLFRRIGGVDGPDSEGAIYAADNPTNDTADEAANGARRLAADVSAMSDAVRNALCLRGERTSK